MFRRKWTVYFASNRFPTFDVDPTIAEPRYLFWWFTPDRVREQLLIGSYRMGDRSRSVVVLSRLLGSRIPLPSLDEQRRIVHRLDSVAALVEERRRAIDGAERETQALLLKAFQRAIDGAPCAPWPKSPPSCAARSRSTWMGSIPKLGVRSFGSGTFHKPTSMRGELSWQEPFLDSAKATLLFSNLMAWEGAVAVASSE